MDECGEAFAPRVGVEGRSAEWALQDKKKV